MIAWSARSIFVRTMPMAFHPSWRPAVEPSLYRRGLSGGSRARPFRISGKRISSGYSGGLKGTAGLRALVQRWKSPTSGTCGPSATVAETRSVSRAAERIHLSQPAITQAIDKLEARLGAPLFEQGRRHGATAAGRLFCARANRALEFASGGARDRPDGRLRPRRARSRPPDDRRAIARADRGLDAGNFSLAARAVGLSQPSIHRAAKELERLAGLPCSRARGGIELTRAAEFWRSRPSSPSSKSSTASTKCRNCSAAIPGASSSAMPLARSHILPEAIDRLTRERPKRLRPRL